MHGTKAIGMGFLVVTDPGRAATQREAAERRRLPAKANRARRVRPVLAKRLPVLRGRFA